MRPRSLKDRFRSFKDKFHRHQIAGHKTGDQTGKAIGNEIHDKEKTHHKDGKTPNFEYVKGHVDTAGVKLRNKRRYDKTYLQGIDELSNML